MSQEVFTCVEAACSAQLAVAASTPRMLQYRAHLAGWGVTDGVVLCPEHCGRKREKHIKLDHLPGDVPLFGEEEEPRPVGRARAKKMSAKDHHS